MDRWSTGLHVPPPRLFGSNINPEHHPQRYGLVALVVLFVASLAVANLRRGAAGRRLLAVRSNERSAAAVGVNVFGAKLYAFGLASAIAGVGGCILAFLTQRDVRPVRACSPRSAS